MPSSFHIHICGQVQGVGFRPFVWRLATEWGLQGWVNNAADGVHIVVNASAERASAFMEALQVQAPSLSRITRATLIEIPAQAFEGFSIVSSDSDAEPNLLLSPDFALCEDCRRELHQAGNRRYAYAFITCTNCGPRFSIVDGLPYDREHTAMRDFEMCPDCRAEYESVSDRRYYSQTNSCAVCGVQLSFYSPGGEVIHEGALALALEALWQGKILAVKGIGGFLLMCDATNKQAINTLRERKHRPSKPFAVLYPNEQTLGADVDLWPEATALLRSAAAPIVLLPLLDKPASGIAAGELAPALDRLGVMLPYAPLLELIAAGFGAPLVATSGNLSGSPIFYTDEQIQKGLTGIADAVLSHNRRILSPQDDSVVQLSKNTGHAIIMRRARGFAPTFLGGVSVNAGRSVLATGAMLKSAFAWQHKGNIYLSPYLGDLENYDTHTHFENMLNRFLGMFNARPQSIVADSHPAYFSTQLAERLAEEWQAPLLKVQHHKAHFAAVLGENDLLEDSEPILGVIWDGTGLGDDGQIWGGEFFVWRQGQISRASHFAYFDFLLGDKMPREPRLSALSLARHIPEAVPLLESKFTPTEWALYHKILQRGGLLQTSSAGRLFDGVASLLGLADKVSYEGEAAMRLEVLARRYFKQNALPASLPPASASTINALIEGLAMSLSREQLAADFHLSLIASIIQEAQTLGCRKIAFSGGVFQNSLLADLAIQFLLPDFELYFHRQLSPNDESIAYGQLLLNNLQA